MLNLSVFVSDPLPHDSALLSVCPLLQSASFRGEDFLLTQPCEQMSGSQVNFSDSLRSMFFFIPFLLSPFPNYKVPIQNRSVLRSACSLARFLKIDPSSIHLSSQHWILSLSLPPIGFFLLPLSVPCFWFSCQLEAWDFERPSPPTVRYPLRESLSFTFFLTM